MTQIICFTHRPGNDSDVQLMAHQTERVCVCVRSIAQLKLNSS